GPPAAELIGPWLRVQGSGHDRWLFASLIFLSKITTKISFVNHKKSKCLKALAELVKKSDDQFHGSFDALHASSWSAKPVPFRVISAMSRRLLSGGGDPPPNPTPKQQRICHWGEALWWVCCPDPSARASNFLFNNIQDNLCYFPAHA